MSTSRFSSVIAFTLFTSLAACGSEGPMGEMGNPGAMGEKGDKGDMGDMGTPGTPGAPGEDGEPGQNGSNGQNGSAGVSCWDLNANLTCDLATEDKNGDNMCSALDCQGSVTNLGQGAGAVFGTAALTLAPDEAAALPGLTLQVSVPATGVYRAYIASNGSAALVGTDLDAYAAVTVALTIDGQVPTSGGFQNMVLYNAATGIDHWSFSTTTLPLSAGNHTIAVNAANFDISTDSVQVSGGSTSGFQGSLNVLLLKM